MPLSFITILFLGGCSKCEVNKGSLQARSYECELWNVANSSVQYTQQYALSIVIAKVTVLCIVTVPPS